MSYYPDQLRRSTKQRSVGKLPVPVPPFVNGLLPAGVHHCTFTEVERACVINYPSDRRRILWEKFQRYVDWVRAPQLFNQIYIDGSFATDKPQPGDIDIVLQTPLSVTELNGRLRVDPTIANYFLESYTKTHFEVHAFPHFQGTNVGRNIIDLFQTLRVPQAQSLGLSPNSRKGILVLDL